MVKNREINGTEEIGLVTPTPVYCGIIMETDYDYYRAMWAHYYMHRGGNIYVIYMRQQGDNIHDWLFIYPIQYLLWNMHTFFGDFSFLN